MNLSNLIWFTEKRPIITYNRAFHIYAIFFATITVILIYMGGLIKTLEAGLSVPDWPLSYGGLNPPRWLEIETVRSEHGHRLMAMFVGLNAIILTIWAWKYLDATKWFKYLVTCSLVMVIVQGILGGLTVLFFLPDLISMSHAVVAQLFLLINVTIVVFSSKSWVIDNKVTTTNKSKVSIHSVSVLVTVSIVIQLLLGAWVRHTESGLAIPDWPLSFGYILPVFNDIHIITAFLHRTWAYVVCGMVIWLAIRIYRNHADSSILLKTMSFLLVLIIAQMSLGAMIIFFERSKYITTFHVPVGAMCLATAYFLFLQIHRVFKSSSSVDHEPVHFKEST